MQSSTVLVRFFFIWLLNWHLKMAPGDFSGSCFLGARAAPDTTSTSNYFCLFAPAGSSTIITIFVFFVIRLFLLIIHVIIQLFRNSSVRTKDNWNRKKSNTREHIPSRKRSDFVSYIVSFDNISFKIFYILIQHSITVLNYI